MQGAVAQARGVCGEQAGIGDAPALQIGFGLIFPGKIGLVDGGRPFKALLSRRRLGGRGRFFAGRRRAAPFTFFARQPPDGLFEVHPVIQLDKPDHVPAFAATEALPQVLVRTDGQGRVLVVVKGAEAEPAFTGLPERDPPGLHQGHQIHPALDRLDLLFVYHLSPVRRHRPVSPPSLGQGNRRPTRRSLSTR